jgi:hypothetical protein
MFCPCICHFCEKFYEKNKVCVVKIIHIININRILVIFMVLEKSLFVLFILKALVSQIKAVQRRAARFASGDYRQTSSVTAMIKQLNWTQLKVRFNMMYRIVYDLVDIPPATYIHQS